MIRIILKYALILALLIVLVKGCNKIVFGSSDKKEITKEFLEKKLQKDLSKESKRFEKELLSSDLSEESKTELYNDHCRRLDSISMSYRSSLDKSTEIYDKIDSLTNELKSEGSKFVEISKDFGEKSVSWVKRTYNKVRDFIVDLW
jgi:hypothetical protein